MKGAAYLPALLLLLMSGWCGTFTGSADASAAVMSHLMLLALVAVAGTSDPFRLSHRDRWLLVGLLVVLAVSLVRSPVPRAGRDALLLPAYLMIPAFVERCWPTSEARRRGLQAISAVTSAISIVALAGAWLEKSPGASLPLGHHNLLAAWLVTLLPLSLLPWRDGGAHRFLAGGAALLGVTALGSTSSLSGLLVFLATLAAAFAGSGARGRALLRRVLLALSILTLLFLALMPLGRSRLAAITAGEDLSLLARWSYIEAAFRGFLERPLLGWGPGSANITLGRFLLPSPGVHPPDQAVADPHSWLFRIAYENGTLGLGLGAALAILILRTRCREEAVDLGLRRAALLSLLAFALISFAGRPAAAPALPVAALLSLGALQSSTRSSPPSATSPPIRPHDRLPPGYRAAGCALLALLLAPGDLAHLLYDRARTAENPRPLLRQAVALDGSFPLYRLRLALLDGAAEEALLAAESSSGVAPYFLLAGTLGHKEGKPWAQDALLSACDLNPLGALAPFRLATGTPGDPRAAVWTARAILSEPLLIAAVAFADHPALLRSAGEEIRRLSDLDPALVDELSTAITRRYEILKLNTQAKDTFPEGPVRRLVLEMDGEGSLSLSLHAFRRLPWPVYLDEAALLANALPEIRRSAAQERETPTDLFRTGGCGLSARTPTQKGTP